MSEAIEILIKADDQASAKLGEVATNAVKASQRAEQLMKSLETPAERYARQLEELRTLQAAGAMTAEQFAAAEAKIGANLKQIADDKSLKEMADETKRLAAEQREADKALSHAQGVLQSLEEPADRYARKLAELKVLHSSGVISAEQFAAAEAKVAQQLQQANNQFQQSGRNTKAIAELGGVIANLTGNSQLASFASQIGAATEKVNQFSEISKAGGAGATTFKLGLMGLAAAGGFAIGKVIADWVWQTATFERQMRTAKEAAQALDQQLKSLAQSRFGERKEDIELIRDPDEKRAAYKSLLGELHRDIAAAGQQANKSKREAEEWAEAWKVTGNRKQYAEDAEQQAKADQDRLLALKAQATEIGKLIGQRTMQNELIRQENAAKEKSENYLETLQQEIEYLKATKDEQIKLDAARNATVEDRGEAERLLRERDAIAAKADAERELAEARQQAREEQEKSAEREMQAIDSLIASEEDRLELQRIELEQGKEAAKAMALVWQGVDEATAKRLAKEESELEKLKQKKADEAAKKDTPEDKVKGGGSLATLSAVESRLLTRGPASQQDRWLEDAAKSLRKIMESTHIAAVFAEESKDNLADVAENTAKTTLMVPVA